MNKRSFIIGMLTAYAVNFVLADIGVEIYSPWSVNADVMIFVALTWIVTIGVYDIAATIKRAVIKIRPMIVDKLHREKSHNEEVIEKEKAA